MTEKDNYTHYCSQLTEVTTQYRNLKPRYDDNGLVYLKGILDIPEDSGSIAGSFLIEIHFRSGFPFRFLKLFETGGLIPDEADWHKYPDGSCCITVPPDEILKCRNGITVLQFVKQFAVPYFANYIYRKCEGKYLNGEYAHGTTGLLQFYSDLFGTESKSLWVKCVECAVGSEKVNCGRNDLCFCGNGKKYKRCHLEVFNKLQLLGKQNILNDFKRFIL